MQHVPAVATTVVALSAAALAAVATSEMALRTGAVSGPWLAWLVPAVIEGGAICAGLLAWQRTAQGVSAWAERCALMVLTTLAVIVNAAHATTTRSAHAGAQGHVLGVVLAAAPPLILVGTVELRLRALALRTPETLTLPDAKADALVSAHAAISSSGRVGDEQEGAQAGDRAEQASAHPGTQPGEQASTVPSVRHEAERPVIEAARPPEVMSATPSARDGQEVREASAHADADARREQPEPIDRAQVIADMLTRDPNVTGSQVAERLGVSPATGRRLLAKARAEAEAAA